MHVLLDDYAAGAATATALVNTAPEVQSRGDALADPAALGHFLIAHGLPVDRAPTADDLAPLHALRTALREAVEGPDPAGHAAHLLDGVAGPPHLHRVVDGTWSWCVAARPGTGVAGAVAVHTATALLGAIRALGADRFRSCAAPDCRGVFVDTSRGGRRRYCEPDVCGNRMHVANHRARRRQTPNR